MDSDTPLVNLVPVFQHAFKLSGEEFNFKRVDGVSTPTTQDGSKGKWLNVNQSLADQYIPDKSCIVILTQTCLLKVQWPFFIAHTDTVICIL